ncbi:hypothetical protein [Paenibacillus sp. MER 99-2]|uniref:hypothetical protein n=1 Tax=Paenibacillus sp. MER 99-2 TaxID=2939572 RepID=UPI00203D9BA2|nr:hypothetical protein [Paenibacillus sp. MER 99-2]MCM3171216.1 hypothetical protein [Paenibacillus sp. MER 99-2]
MFNYRNARVMLLILSLILLCTPGCGLVQKAQTPEEIFSLALSGLAGKEKLSFEGQAGLRRENNGVFENQFKFAGKLEDHNRLTLQTRLPGVVNSGGTQMSTTSVLPTGQPGGFSASFQRKKGQWMALSNQQEPLRGALSRYNPISQLENIDRMNKTIKSEYGGGRRTQILRIELNPEDAKTWAMTQLDAEMSAMREEYMHKASAIGGVNQTKLEQELERVWEQGESTMDKMMEPASVQTVYHLTVDRKTSLPLRLSSESQISYQDMNNKKSTEALVTDVNFGEYQ